MLGRKDEAAAEFRAFILGTEQPSCSPIRWAPSSSAELAKLKGL